MTSGAKTRLKHGLVMSCVLLLGAGCAEVPAVQPPNDVAEGNESNRTTITNNSEYAQNNHSLDSSILDVITADNRTLAAAENNIQFRDGRILVVIELQLDTKTSFLSQYDADITARTEKRVQAWVPIDHLSKISNHDKVKFIRAPQTPTQTSLQQ